MNRGCKYGIGLTGVILLLFIANLLIGSVNIPPAEVWHILTGGESSKASWSFIVWEARLPQALTALLCGGALAVCGLMLQTAFKNPLAGPSILGINSGASLGVAFVMLLFGGSVTAVSSGRSLHRSDGHHGPHPVLLYTDQEQRDAAHHRYHDRLHCFVCHLAAQFLCHGRGGAVVHHLGHGKLRRRLAATDARLCISHFIGTGRRPDAHQATQCLVTGGKVCREPGSEHPPRAQLATGSNRPAHRHHYCLLRSGGFHRPGRPPCGPHAAGHVQPPLAAARHHSERWSRSPSLQPDLHLARRCRHYPTERSHSHHRRAGHHLRHCKST